MFGIFGDKPGCQSVGVYKFDQFVYSVDVFGNEQAHFGVLGFAVPIVHMVGAKPCNFVYYGIGKAQPVFAERVAYDIFGNFFMSVHIAEFFDAVRLSYIVHKRGKAYIGRSETNALERVFQNVVLVILVVLLQSRFVLELRHEIFERAYLIEQAKRAVLSVCDIVFRVSLQNFNKLVAFSFGRDIFKKFDVGFCGFRRFGIYLKAQFARKANHTKHS